MPQRTHTPAFPDDDIVDPFPKVAQDCSMSEATLQREIKAGRGPIVTWLSPRRRGVRRKHRRQWLDARSSG